ncbi:Gfo/Idh/MocA family oxidoreductase [Gryllotalpicola protaetiae]|uniref:Oxidoreductase n=1 Tax=Gryllotalpicola protaetiae TaxID=2419771 RepID=A0A387BLW8_9MICO|nr:Gfo/Idh/MocA family oxidoreductase [Gryllotalpicola protaetiae]AYG03638.1 oxidoreductase [Gryllotalpicola protaetiae]
MSQAVLRVALIGYGLAGETFHGPLLEATSGYEVAVVVTGDPGRAAKAARNHPAARIVATVDELWQASADLDLVVVASPNAHHADQAIAALRHGLAVVIDKPIAGTVEDAERLLAVRDETGGFLSIFQNRRWDSDFLTVKDLVASERLGTIRRFESRFELWQPAVTQAWRDDADAAAGGGVLIDLGAHLIDQAVQLFGPVASLYADQFHGRAGTQVDDDSFVALHHESGVVSHLWTSKLAADLGPRFRILGSRGAYSKRGLDPQEDQAQHGLGPASASWGVDVPENWGRLSDGETEVVIPSRPGAYQGFYIELRDAIRSDGRPPVAPEDSLYTLRLLAAARVSATEGRAVSVDGLGRVADAE